jgi:hypothetical protein
MSSNPLSNVLAEFDARMQKSKNRLIAIPAKVQRAIGLERQEENHLLLVSLRHRGKGRWNRHYVKLTFDNEFSIPSDVTSFQQEDALEVKIHRVIADRPALPPTGHSSGAGLLLKLSKEARPGWREDGAERIDEYLNETIHG